MAPAEGDELGDADAEPVLVIPDVDFHGDR
jgi:hypothetical protein